MGAVNTDRCRAALEAAVPDTPGHTRETVVLQCERPAGHRGVHRYDYGVSWSDPAPEPTTPHRD